MLHRCCIPKGYKTFHLHLAGKQRYQWDMLATRNTAATRLPTVRAAISNGKGMLPGIDGRSAAARRYRDLVADLAADLGGEAALTSAELALVRQAAATTMRAEQLQAAIVRGETVTSDDLVRLSNASARILGALRSKRQFKPPVPSLKEYLASRAAAAPIASPTAASTAAVTAQTKADLGSVATASTVAPISTPTYDLAAKQAPAAAAAGAPAAPPAGASRANDEAAPRPDGQGGAST